MVSVEGSPEKVREWWAARVKRERRAAVKQAVRDLDRVREALETNEQWLGRSVAPTAAQTVAQVDRLTRQVSTLLRLVDDELLDDD